MAAPKGSYTPKSGPLAGRTFELRSGDAPTAPYNRYQQALAQTSGFPNRSAERRATADPTFRMLEARLRSLKVSRNDARRQVAAFNPKGKSKSAVIAWSVENDLYDTGDEAALEYYGSTGE